MSENLRETDSETNLNNAFYPSEEEAELTETAEELEDDTVEEDEELAEGEEEAEEESETIELDGQEISAETLKEWKLSHDNRKHQQADYTKKGQAAAEQMKIATSELEKYQGLNNSLQESVDAMELLLNEEENAIDWDELSDTDPGEALKLERKFKKKRAELKSAKSKVEAAKKQADAAKIQEQSRELAVLMPDWFNTDGSASKVSKQETDSIIDYLKDKHYPANYANQVSTAKEWELLRDASKHHSLQKKKPAITKKIKRLKTANGKVKPKATESTSLRNMDAKTANSLFFNT
jgi:hypothetical protein|tara:strand:- start:2759 stop:3640 length:882 start_codon:yes stop_codon:yes gene_type:complete